MVASAGFPAPQEGEGFFPSVSAAGDAPRVFSSLGAAQPLSPSARAPLSLQVRQGVCRAAEAQI